MIFIKNKNCKYPELADEIEKIMAEFGKYKPKFVEPPTKKAKPSELRRLLKK